MSKYNDEIARTLSIRKLRNSNKIDWVKLNDGKTINVLLIELESKSSLSYIEKMFQTAISNIELSKLIQYIQLNVQYYSNELKVATEIIIKNQLEDIEEGDEFTGGS